LLHPVFSQPEDTTNIFNCKNKKILSAGLAGVSYAGSMSLLYQLWYKDFPQSSFHFHNDNKEWLQMDKVGHAYSAYHLGELGYYASRFSCINETKSVWVGGALGLIYLTTIELFDGYSAGWGASSGDLISNVSGYLLFAGQQQLWKEQRFRMKFSYFPGKYAQYRPDQLGSSFPASLLKDYNAQSYWLSFSPATFSAKDKTLWPKWLCISVGYSADGMLGANSNPSTYQGSILPVFERQREVFLSLDIDLSRIKTSSKTLSLLLHALNLIKIPFPALQYSQNDGLNWRWLYF